MKKVLGIEFVVECNQSGNQHWMLLMTEVYTIKQCFCIVMATTDEAVTCEFTFRLVLPKCGW